MRRLTTGDSRSPPEAGGGYSFGNFFGNCGYATIFWQPIFYIDSIFVHLHIEAGSYLLKN